MSSFVRPSLSESPNFIPTRWVLCGSTSRTGFLVETQAAAVTDTRRQFIRVKKTKPTVWPVVTMTTMSGASALRRG